MKAEQNPTQVKTAAIQPRLVVQQMTPYEVSDIERAKYVRLDFNENTSGFDNMLGFGDVSGFGAQARSGFGAQSLSPGVYPEYSIAIHEQIASVFGAPADSIMLTNGSDEALSVIAQTYIEPGLDAAVLSEPTFSMIERNLLLAGATVFKVPVQANLDFAIEQLDATIKQKRPKTAMFASPDNPTGATISVDTISRWCSRFAQTLFVIDEAYADYTGVSMVPLTARYGNLLVTKTFSKAWGLAGLRLGAVIGRPELLAPMYCVRLPFSVNSAVLSAARALLPEQSEVEKQCRALMQRKQLLLQTVAKRGFTVVEGAANFFLLNAGAQAAELSAFLKGCGILVRNRSEGAQGENPLWGMIRVTVGTERENDALIGSIDRYLKGLAPERVMCAGTSGGADGGGGGGRGGGGASSERAPRFGRLSRTSKETSVTVDIGFDTSGSRMISTPLPFFSHMLDAFACHGKLDLRLSGTGDIEVDPHHLMEDTGIVLGKSIRKALQGFSGIERAGCFLFPMDGTIAQVAIDLCGRSNLAWDVKFGSFPVGNLDPNLFREFFKGLADGIGATIHVSVPYSDNDHHVIEAIFKAFGRALYGATRRLPPGARMPDAGYSGSNGRSASTLSTKGMFDEQED